MLWNLFGAMIGIFNSATDKVIFVFWQETADDSGSLDVSASVLSNDNEVSHLSDVSFATAQCYKLVRVTFRLFLPLCDGHIIWRNPFMFLTGSERPPICENKKKPESEKRTQNWLWNISNKMWRLNLPSVNWITTSGEMLKVYQYYKALSIISGLMRYV